MAWISEKDWYDSFLELELCFTEYCHAVRSVIERRLWQKRETAPRRSGFQSNAPSSGTAHQAGGSERGVNFAQPKTGSEKRADIGNIEISIKHGDLNLRWAKAYFVVELGLYRFASPVVFPGNDGRFTWEITLTLPVEDITADIRLLFFRSNYIFQDSLLGQVILPVVSFLPNTSRSSQSDTEAFKICGVFELFPLGVYNRKFKAASSKIPGVGMQRPSCLLGSVALNSKLVLRQQKIWPLYFTCPRQSIEKPTEESYVAAVQDVLVQLKEVQRHFARVEEALARFKASVAPIAFLLHAVKSWDYPLLSVMLLTLSLLVPYFLPSYVVPLVALICTYCFSLHCCYEEKSRELNENPLLLWQDQGAGESKGGISVEGLMKFRITLLNIERFLGHIASTFEKVLNALCWKDENASFSVFVVLSILTLAWTAIIIMPLYTFASYSLYLGIACVIPTSLKKRLVDNSIVGKFFINAVSRVPCQDEYAHRRIAEMQRVKDRSHEDSR